ncbi:isoprenylcysteine carboxylmethyltransferase family protein [Chitinophaga sp. XS-30]|nr:isoprenylcysteine carboxylmethyltransferase family protein [Chitinophaga sp. XS-30]
MPMKKLIPPFLLFICLLLMVAASLLIPQPHFINPPWHLTGLTLLAAGAAMAIWTSRKFRQRNTAIHTFRAPGTLVTDGLFRFSRNPVYLGFSMILAGVTLLLGVPSSLYILLLFILITDRWYIRYEEQEMEKIFGDAYRLYKARVRRWL